MVRYAIVSLVLLVGLSGTALAQVHEKVLDNGLKVIVKEDHRAPVVVSQIWYKVGSSYEYGGITGVSHVLEHMMFQGTAAHPAGEFSRIISENGGSENAFTGRDYTAYFQQLEASRLPISFELEADRMRNLLLPEKEFQKERNVVMEERRLRTEDRPRSLTYEQFLGSAYLASPYHNPIIGWTNDLKNLDIDDLKKWYRKWYAPNNATLVVAGDVKAQEVFDLAEKYFGAIEPSEIDGPKPRLEPKQLGERQLQVEAPAELPFLVMGYKVPVLKTLPKDEQWKAYALEVLAGVLDGGDSARLSSELVRGRQIAASAGAGYDLYARLENLLTLQGTPAPGHTVAELEKALREEINRLSEKPVAPDELERIKAQVAASKVFEQDSVFYQAMQIGMLETVGLDRTLADEYLDRIRAVTAEQVQQVAREFLKEDQLTVAVLDPQPLDNERPQAKGGSHAPVH
jgi:zinc protease